MGGRRKRMRRCAYVSRASLLLSGTKEASRRTTSRNFVRFHDATRGTVKRHNDVRKAGGGRKAAPYERRTRWREEVSRVGAEISVRSYKGGNCAGRWRRRKGKNPANERRSGEKMERRKAEKQIWRIRRIVLCIPPGVRARTRV